MQARYLGNVMYMKICVYQLQHIIQNLMHMNMINENGISQLHKNKNKNNFILHQNLKQYNTSYKLLFDGNYVQ